MGTIIYIHTAEWRYHPIVAIISLPLKGICALVEMVSGSTENADCRNCNVDDVRQAWLDGVGKTHHSGELDDTYPTSIVPETVLVRSLWPGIGWGTLTSSLNRMLVISSVLVLLFEAEYQDYLITQGQEG